jgi:hypothetical protein
MANKSLQVTICLEFDGIDDADSDAATEIIDRLTNACRNMEQRYEAADVWVNDAFIVYGGNEVAA